MKEWVRRNLYVIYSSVLLLFIVNYFVSNNYMEYVIGVAAIFMLLLSFEGASKLFRILGVVFCTCGMVFYIYAGLSFYKLPLFMSSTMPLLAFITVLPFMTSVVHASRFDRRINELLNVNVSDLGQLYSRSSFTSYILTLFVNISALTISQEVLQSNLKVIQKKIKDAFVSSTTLRAFACAQAWSPMEIIVAITVDSTKVSFFSLLPWLLLCSTIVILGDWLFGQKKFKSIPYQSVMNRKTIQLKKISMDILKLLLALMVFLLLVVMIGSYFNLNFILSVTLVLVPFTFLWAFLLRRLRTFWIVGWKTWKTHTNNLQNFMVLFLSLALFSNGLSETQLNQLIQQPFLTYIDKPIIILVFIQLLFLLMGLLGIHAIATIGVLIEVLDPLYSLINPLSIGVVLISGAMATATVGPYGVTVTMTSMNTLQNPYRITLRNLPFALFYAGVGLVIGMCLA